jgi:hypothetical protein
MNAPVHKNIYGSGDEIIAAKSPAVEKFMPLSL